MLPNIGNLKSYEINNDILGLFCPRIFSVYQKEHYFTVMQKQFDRLSLDNPNYFGLDSEGFLGLCQYTLWVHEFRHFYDYITHPIFFDFAVQELIHWSYVKIILSQLNKKQIIKYMPLKNNVHKLLKLLGGKYSEIVFEESNYFLKNSFFLDYHQSNTGKGFDKSKFYNYINLNNQGYIPVYYDSKLYHPINMISLLEGSAIFSQISFLSSQNGRRLWKDLEKISIKSGNYNHYICLKIISDVFKEDVLFNTDNYLGIRSIFRFSLYGHKPYLPRDTFGNYLKSPSFRFLETLKLIKEGNLQQEFLTNPNQVLIEIHKLDVCWKEKRINEFFNFINSKNNIKEEDDKNSNFNLELDIFSVIENMFISGLKLDVNKLDLSRDILWAHDEKNIPPPGTPKPPIEFFNFNNKEDMKIIKFQENERERWMMLFILDSIVHQISNNTVIYCPFSKFKLDCSQRKELKKYFLIESCKENNCIVKDILEYLHYIK